MSKTTLKLEQVQTKIFKMTAELKMLKEAEKNLKALVKIEVKASAKKVKK